MALTRDGLELHKASLDNAGALTVEKIRTIEGVESAEWSPQGDLVNVHSRLNFVPGSSDLCTAVLGMCTCSQAYSLSEIFVSLLDVRSPVRHRVCLSVLDEYGLADLVE